MDKSQSFPGARRGILYNRSGMGLSLAAQVNAVEALGRLGDECVIPCLIGVNNDIYNGRSATFILAA